MHEIEISTLEVGNSGSSLHGSASIKKMEAKFIKAKYGLVPKPDAGSALPVLSDFDWNAVVTVASSTLSSMRIPLLQLSVVLSDGTSAVIELNREELQDMISCLDDAAVSLDEIVPQA